MFVRFTWDNYICVWLFIAVTNAFIVVPDPDPEVCAIHIRFVPLFANT